MADKKPGPQTMLALALALGGSIDVPRREICILCEKPIAQGDGSRMMPQGGWAHGRCAKAQEEVLREQG